ncbi:hypothetical protein [Bradyrhizobium sp. SZCCHNS3051]|uniref:hypothetical protein n=1 Tax=Bradyrhizobium sp. SZCCHNS3051 TaxID=3057320 RepID=UPI00291604F0|nr:hypothetical protein [Bradyrhizobium sp. SZCCHNS3051]
MYVDAAREQWLRKAAVGLEVPGDAASPNGVSAGTSAGLSPEELDARQRAKLAGKIFADEKRKQLALADVARTLKPLKPILRDAFNLQVTMDGKTTQLQAKAGDLLKATEVEDVRGNATISKGGTKPSKASRRGKKPMDAREDAALIEQARKAYDVIMTLRARLEAMTTTRSIMRLSDGGFFLGVPEPLFTNPEVTEELFTPLVREKILPDTIVTGRYSAVQKMLDGSTALYQEELQEASRGSHAVAADILKMAVDIGSNVVDAVLRVAGADTELATTLLQGSVELCKLSIDFSAKLADGIDVAGTSDLLNGLPSIVGPLVGTIITSIVPEGDASLGEEISAAISGGGEVITRSVNAVVISIQTRKPSPSALIALISAIISAELAQVIRNADPDLEDAVVTADTIQSALAAPVRESKHADPFFEFVLKGDMERAREEMFEFVKEVMLNAQPGFWSDIYGLLRLNDCSTSGSEADDVASTLDTVAGVTSAIHESLEALKIGAEERKAINKKAKEALKQFDASKLLENLDTKLKASAEHRKRLNQDPKELADDLKKKLAKEQQEFANELRGLDNPTISDKSIDKLIAKMQRDRCIMSVAIAIGKGGGEVGSLFLAPLQIGNQVIKMAMNLAAAVERAMELHKCLKEKAGARSAVSPYMSSIQNFVSNQAYQMTEYSIRVALNGVNIAASVAATAYPMATPAVPAAAAVSAGAELLFTAYNEARLLVAWKVWKQALLHPTNRKLGLRARKLNPTLAKYTLAYGATVARDPIAVHMCQACGLAPKDVVNADARKIKAFLEAKFDEDGQVVKKLKSNAEEPAMDWVVSLPEPELSTASVFRTYVVIKDAFARGLIKEDVPRGDTSRVIITNLLPPAELTAMLRLLASELADDASAREIERG